jgi:hypothetical protein
MENRIVHGVFGPKTTRKKIKIPVDSGAGVS